MKRVLFALATGLLSTQNVGGSNEMRQLAPFAETSTSLRVTMGVTETGGKEGAV